MPEGVVFAKDNGCFGDGWVGFGRWIGFLEQHQDARDRCLFATAPDVVADAYATLEASRPWLPAIRALGYKAALVGQNGLDLSAVPWDEFDVLFLGGVPECVPCNWVQPPRVGDDDERKKPCPKCGRALTEWKLGAQAYALILEAKRRGMWVHMGRVNSFKRLLAAHERGCDSADGTYVTLGPDENLPTLLGWLRLINHQGELFPRLGGVA